jgi:SAM-dependent methyltransferase
MHAPMPVPSAWVTRWAPLMRPGGHVLDLACGSGRHLRWLAERGWQLTGVDRDEAAVAPLRNLPGVAEIIVADIEGGPWPLAGRRFDGIVVTNYLWRALLPCIEAALAAGGVLIYETFAVGNELFGKPSNPDFLLRPGELLSAFPGLRIVAYESGLEAAPDRVVQRLVAVAQADSHASAAGPEPSDPAAKIAAFGALRLQPSGKHP